jgi:hypothetical protein
MRDGQYDLAARHWMRSSIPRSASWIGWTALAEAVGSRENCSANSGPIAGVTFPIGWLNWHKAHYVVVTEGVSTA